MSYLQIVDDIRRRIESGALAAGDRVPSTRQITRTWGVAMATATKALAALQQEGLVRAVPGVGTVVAARPAPAVPARELTQERILSTATRIADTEGLAAVSMRRLATELGVATMALYRHVRGKGELVQLMADRAYGEARLPAEPPTGWRAQIETSLRLQWAAHRRHPWLAHAFPLTRPQYLPNGMAHTEWLMRAVSGLGLDANTVLHVSVSLAGFIRGIAVNLEPEAQAIQDTGITDDEWMRAQERTYAELFASGAYPTMAAVLAQPGLDLDLDSLFEFGLRRQLDGIAALVGRSGD